MLRELEDFGFTNLTGIDYSPSSIKLAAQICPNLADQLFQADILKSDERFAAKYKIAMDKGTFDAISLTPSDKETAIAKYSQNVAQMLEKKGDYLFITRWEEVFGSLKVWFRFSCNWTTDELKKHFAKQFELVTELKVPKFKFGGKEGSSTVSVLFSKL